LQGFLIGVTAFSVSKRSSNGAEHEIPAWVLAAEYPRRLGTGQQRAGVPRARREEAEADALSPASTVDQVRPPPALRNRPLP
jgi:hypothetical protein